MELWPIVLATFLGPIAAVLITLWYQARDRAYLRRLAVFRSLMQWRRQMLSQEFVGNLNLVPIEFHDYAGVQLKFKTLFRSFQDNAWTSEDQNTQAQLQQKVQSEVADLLSEMATALNIPIKQLEILNEAYSPRGWQNDETLNRMARMCLVQILAGQRSLPVVFQTGQQPPPPDLNRGP